MKYDKARKLAPIVVGLLRFSLASLLVGSGILHLQNLPRFYLAIARYEFPVFAGSYQLSLVIPPLSIIAGGFLVSSPSSRIGSILAVGLFSCFSIAQASAVFRGLEIDCGCFPGIESEVVGIGTVARSVALLCVAIFLAAHDLLNTSYVVRP